MSVRPEGDASSDLCIRRATYTSQSINDLVTLRTGTVISYGMDGDEESLVAFASRILSKPENNYLVGSRIALS